MRETGVRAGIIGGSRSTNTTNGICNFHINLEYNSSWASSSTHVGKFCDHFRQATGVNVCTMSTGYYMAAPACGIICFASANSPSHSGNIGTFCDPYYQQSGVRIGGVGGKWNIKTDTGIGYFSTYDYYSAYSNAVGKICDLYMQATGKKTAAIVGGDWTSSGGGIISFHINLEYNSSWALTYNRLGNFVTRMYSNLVFICLNLVVSGIEMISQVFIIMEIQMEIIVVLVSAQLRNL